MREVIDVNRMKGSRRTRTACIAVISILALLLAACGGNGQDDGETDDGSEATADGEEGQAEGEGEVPQVHMTVEPSAVPVFVADDRDLFEGVEVEVTQTGYDQVQSLLLAGDTDVAWVSPLETATFVSEGSELRYFSTAGAQNMYNGVVVRAEDADTYESVEDLQGERLGIPGFGTGTWAAFDVFMRAYFDIDDPQNAFDVHTADSGALLGLLENGEIDGALLFSGTSAAARSLDQFETIFSFTEALQEEAGQPLAVNGSVATADWLEQNPEAAQRVEEGIDAAVEWIKENTSEFQEGGEYAGLAEEAGFLTDEETATTVTDLMVDGPWYLSSDAYSDEWIDALYQLIEAGEGTIVESVPAREDVFVEPGSVGSD